MLGQRAPYGVTRHGITTCPRVRRTVRTGLLVMTSALSVVACGSSGDTTPRDISVTSTSVPGVTTPTPVPTTTAEPATTPARAEATRGCLAVLADGLKLVRDYSRDVRSFAGADEAAYRARAQALIDEGRRLGCRIPPGVEDFLQ